MVWRMAVVSAKSAFCTCGLFVIILIFTIYNIKIFLKTLDSTPTKLATTEINPRDGVTHEKFRLNDVLRLKKSVLNELVDLEAKRTALLTQIDILASKAEQLHKNLQSRVQRFTEINKSIEHAKAYEQEIRDRDTPEIYLPRKSVVAYAGDNEEFSSFTLRTEFCTMENCFDHSRCSIASQFTVKLTGINISIPKVFELTKTDNYCIHFINSSHLNGEVSFFNHVIIHSSDLALNYTTQAMVASPTFPVGLYRRKFDFVIPPLNNDNGFQWLPLMSPARRAYFLALFSGPDDAHTYRFVIDYLLSKTSSKSPTRRSSTADKFYVDSNCSIGDFDRKAATILPQSTFALILPRSGHVTTLVDQSRLISAIKLGSIPVVLNGDFVYPLDEFVDWRRCSINLPAVRIYELHFRLKSIDDFDLLELRRQCRILFDTYFSGAENILKTLLAAVQYRLQLNLASVGENASNAHFASTDSSVVTLEEIRSPQANLFDADEFLGPVGDLPHSSVTYQQNVTVTNLLAYERWNTYADPFLTYPFNPFRPVAPSEAKFIGSTYGFRPINAGLGGSGKPFIESLGGNVPKEQFTVILLTYEREHVLIEALARLNRLPYLHKIIVVWNGHTPPALNHTWPKLTAPYIILKMANNSLNNRFLPFAEVETEAVLSIDDDVHLRQDEIVFGFRVWREARDRIVGFPGRFHGWDRKTHQWIYNSNHSCELSMVLTGAAFIHKFYLHKYTNEMNPVIRTKVDEIMNCEDIAMNFLVSHITRKPPLKVTSRWTFRCPTCTETLSADESHFNERHDCINFLTNVYGYNPLINTQFRVDSILFKTRVPPNHQKCFKFI